MNAPVASLSCDICQIVFSGPESAQQHYASRKHQKQALGVQMGLESGRVYDFDGDKGRCYICCVAFTSREDADQHLQGGKHKLQENRLKASNEKGQVPISDQQKIINRTTRDETINVLSQTKTPNLSVSRGEIIKDSINLKANNLCGSTESGDEFVFDNTTKTGYCNLCNLSLTSYNNAYQHLNGISHHKKHIRVSSLKSKPVVSKLMTWEVGPQTTDLPDRYGIRYDPSPEQPNQNLLPKAICENRHEEIEPISQDDNNMQYSGITIATSQQNSKILPHILCQGEGQINQFQYADRQPKNFTGNTCSNIKLGQPVNKTFGHVLEKSQENLLGLQNRLTNKVSTSGTLTENAPYECLADLYDLSQSIDNDEFAFDCRKNNGYCYLCDIALTSDKNAKEHLAGERHQKKKIKSKQQIILEGIKNTPRSHSSSCSQQKAMADSEQEVLIQQRTQPEPCPDLTTVQPMQQTQCNAVQVNQPSKQRPTQQTIPEVPHQTTFIDSKQSSDKTLPNFTLSSDVVDRTLWYNCDVCQKLLNSMGQLEIHKSSPRHKRQEAKINATRLLYPGTIERNLQSSLQRLEELNKRSMNDLDQPGNGHSDGTVDIKGGNHLLPNEVNTMQESATHQAANATVPGCDNTDL